jgi:hypothetical protein
MPAVVAAADSESASQAMLEWIQALGKVADCSSCAAPTPGGWPLQPDLDWIRDERALGADLSRALVQIHANRKPQSAQFYVSLNPGVLNPAFDNELAYSSLRYPDAGFQLLALFRYWNMVQHFSPNRNIMSDDPENSRTTGIECSSNTSRR